MYARVLRPGRPLPPDAALLDGLRHEQRVVVTAMPEKVLSWAR